MPWAQQRQFLQAAQGQLDKLDFLLQALVKTSRLETGLITLEKRDRPVADTLAAALNTVLAPWRPRGSALRWTARRASPSPHDPKWTAEALSNLLDNAVKYTPPGGQVAVAVTPWDTLVKIDVADTGRGIPEGGQGAIFQRFYRGGRRPRCGGGGAGPLPHPGDRHPPGGLCEGVLRPGAGGHLSLFLPGGETIAQHFPPYPGPIPTQKGRDPCAHLRDNRPEKILRHGTQPHPRPGRGELHRGGGGVRGGGGDLRLRQVHPPPTWWAGWTPPPAAPSPSGGKALDAMNDEQLTIFRRRNIGFVFQHYNLVPMLNVYENIVLPVELDGETPDPAFLQEVVGMLGLEEKLTSMPHQLSGGQQQRVAIARA